MQHGGDIYRNKIEYDFSVSINPYYPEGIIDLDSDDIVKSFCTYPDIKCESLKNSLSKRYGIEEKYIVCGNGASELLLGIVRAITPRNALILSPTFYGYEYVLGDCNIKRYSLTESDDYSLSDDYISSLSDDLDIIFLGNPENPTGKRIDNDLLHIILDRAKRLSITVVLDESFYELSLGGIREDLDWLLHEYSNLCVVNSFTKTYGIPGIRLGFCFIGNEQIKEKIERNLPEWNVSGIAQSVGIKLSDDKEYLQESYQRLIIGREYLYQSLCECGFRVYRSDANYILFYTEMPIYDELIKKGIMIKNCENTNGLGHGYYRIAVKDQIENEMLIKSIRQIICNS